MALRPKAAPAMGPPRLEWQRNPHNGVWSALRKVERGYSRSALTYEETSLFAIVRPALAGDALFTEANGYVVTRTTFDDLRSFPTIEEAKLYVESLFALERE